MKNYGRKCIVFLVAVVIALGVVMTITGCEEKCTTTTKTTTVEKTTQK